MESVTGADALIALVGNNYCHAVLEDRARIPDLRVLTQVARSVPIRRITPADSPARIWELCETIVRDFRALESGPSATPAS